MICGFSGAQAGRRITFLDNKCCLLSALTETEVKGRGRCSGSSLLILFYVRQQPFEEPQCTFVCVSVCGCVLGLLWSVTDPGFYPARLTVRFHMSSGFYCSRRAERGRKMWETSAKKRSEGKKQYLNFFSQLISWMILLLLTG